MSKNQSLFLELITRALTSLWLPFLFFINAFGSGFLFPIEETIPGFNSHLSDAIAGIAVVCVFLVARKVAQSRECTTLSWDFSLVTAAVGTLAGTGFSALYAFMVSSEGVSTSRLPELFAYPLFSIFAQIFALTLLVGTFKYSRHTSQALAEERLALKLIQENLRKEVEVNRSELIERIETTISPVIRYLESDLKQNMSTAEALEKIHSAISEVVRPLSHALDEQVELKNIGDLDRTQLARQLRKDSLTYKLKRPAHLSLSVSPLITLVTYVAFHLVALHYLFGLQGLLKVGVPFIAVAQAIFWLNRRLWGDRKTQAVTVFGIGATIAVTLSTLFSFLGTAQGFDSELINPIGFSVFVITIAACWFELALDRTRESRRGVEQANIEIARSISEVRKKLWYLRKRIARELHGGLQSKLQVLALQINMNQKVEPASLIDFYEEMKQSISSEGVDERHQTLEEYLRDLHEFWSGVTRIESSVSTQASMVISGNLVLNECLREVIREAINNAIKHAGATEIYVSVEQLSNSQINLMVTNNIIKLGTTARTFSLGSKIFEELSDSWDLTVGADRSTLIATFGANSHIN